jgi:hypothetical protein
LSKILESSRARQSLPLSGNSCRARSAVSAVVNRDRARFDAALIAAYGKICRVNPAKIAGVQTWLPGFYQRVGAISVGWKNLRSGIPVAPSANELDPSSEGDGSASGKNCPFST